MKRITALLLCIVLILSVSGCGGDKGPKEITLLTLTDYIPKDILNEFTEKTGIKVSHVTASSYDEIKTMVEKDPSAYDLVIACDYVIDAMVKGKLLQEIDYKKFENSKYVVPGYTGKYYDPENRFTVPYAAVAILIGYNPYDSGIIIDSYGDLLAPTLKNSIVFTDDPSVIVGISNMAIGKSPNYYNVSMPDTGKILRGLRQNAYVPATSTDFPEDALINGDASVAVLYSMQLGYAISSNTEIEIAYPKEGFIYSIDCMAIPSGADGKDYSMQFINYAHDPVVNGKLCQEIGYSSTNTSGKQFMDEEYRNDGYNISNDKAGEGVLFLSQTQDEKNKFVNLYKEQFLNKLLPTESPVTEQPAVQSPVTETPAQ